MRFACSIMGSSRVDYMRFLCDTKLVWTRSSFLILCSITVLGAGLRIYNLSNNMDWDESYCYNLAEESVLDQVTFTLFTSPLDRATARDRRKRPDSESREGVTRGLALARFLPAKVRP